MMEVAINSVARMNGFTPSTTITAVAAAAAAASSVAYSTPTTTCSGKNGRIFTFNSSSLSSLAATAVASARTGAGVGNSKRTVAVPLTTTSASSLLSLSALTAGVATCGTVGTFPVSITSSLSPSSTTTTTKATLPPPSSLISSSSATTPTTLPPSTTSATTSTTPSTSSSNSKNYKIPSDILDDLASRFIINVPDDERNNLIRICFQIELAHWFYLDFFCAIVEKKLQPCGIKQFAMQLFQHIPFLQKHLSTIDKILEDWKNYKLSVPTYGAILISEDLSYVLLVQSYFAKSSWGFPKGKVNETEDPVHCATREVYEETGYDITGLIVPNDYIEAVINYQYTRLYIVRNVPLQTHFSPRTRNEIKCCDWFPIDSLPINKNDAISKANLGINANSFFMIMPFVKRLKKWVNDNRSGIETRRKYPPTNTNNLNLNSNSTITSVVSSSAGAGTGVGVGVAVLSISPPTVAGNNSGGGAGSSGGGGGGVNVCNGSSPTSMLMMKQNNLTNISNSCKKDLDSNMRIYNENIALNNGNGSVSNNNQNNNGSSRNHNNNKRQRHKSMGDIDGIKLNISANTNCNNCKSNQGGTKASNNNSANKHANNKVMQHQQQCSSVGMTAAVATTATGAPPKRQLFHSQSQSGTSTMSSIYSDEWTNRKQAQVTISYDAIRKEPKIQQQQQQQQQQQHHHHQQREKDRDNKNAVVSNNNNNAGCDKQPKKVNNRQRTKSQGASSSNNQQLQQSSVMTNGNQINKQQPLKTAKEKQQQQRFTSLTPPPPSSPNTPSSKQQTPNEKTRSVSLSSATVTAKTSQKIKPRSVTPQHQTANQKTSTTTAASNQILKFNPNFDSWTNFSFTKNFIANVFC